MTSSRLVAADTLSLDFDADAQWRLAWGEPDWLGPIAFALAGTPASHSAALRTFNGHDDLGTYISADIEWHDVPLPIRTSVRAYRDAAVIVFRIEARDAIDALATGRFDQPCVAWPAFFPSRRGAGGVPEGTRSYGHQYTEFALPVTGDAACAGFLFAPHRPPVVEPLLFIAPDGRTLLLAPLDHFHEQIIAVPADREHVTEGVRCGWHGDLAMVPAGFATELVVWAADSPRQALTVWADFLQRRHATQRLPRDADELLGKLSYWTDNGAVYYYRTERDCDYVTTLERVVADARAHGVPVQSVQIDSWFYPHQNSRPVSAEGAPVVPPSGMLKWEPRADLFPDGFRDLRTRLGNLPLTFHSRHFSSQSPYFDEYAAWRDGDYAHPAEPRLYDALMAAAAGWGAITYEQDWMVESFLGVRGLREVPGRARAWQEQLDAAATAHGLHLQWCMATPADFFQSVTLRNVASIRTSGDYRYMFDNGLNWVWFLHTNALARAFSLVPFKDVFLSHGATSMSVGEPYAEVEALLAGLSTGPVGIGDQLGCTNRDLVLRTCREDGVLIKPDVPIAAIDRCFRANSFLEPSPLIGECYSAHPAGRWVYVASFNAHRTRQSLDFRVELAALGESRPTAPVLAFDWRRRATLRLEADGSWDVSLAFQDWDYHIVCPLLPGDVTVFGDVSKYATVGDRRVARIASVQGDLHFDVLGAPQTSAEVHGYAATRPAKVTTWTAVRPRTLAFAATADTRDESWSWDEHSGQWRIRIRLDRLGYVHVVIVPAG